MAKCQSVTPQLAPKSTGLVLNHLAADGPDIGGAARSLLADLEAELRPEVVAAGLERGKSVGLEIVVKELLEEAP